MLGDQGLSHGLGVVWACIDSRRCWGATTGAQADGRDWEQCKFPPSLGRSMGGR